MDRILRFGLFEIDAVSGELRKEGRPLKLQDQPFQVLLFLVERAGEVVSREELQQAVWPADTFVDFDHGVNTAIRKIRQALGDSADNPRFIETLPRKGYRFIAPVSQPGEPEPAPAPPPAPIPSPKKRWLIPAAVASLTVIFLVGEWYFVSRPASMVKISNLPTPLTTYPGAQINPNFSPDGRMLAFAWNGTARDNFDIYIKHLGVEDPVRLTNDPARDSSPVFSPDGKQIAFMRATGAGPSKVMVMPATGGPEVEVGQADGIDNYMDSAMIAWTPDGRSVLASKVAKRNPLRFGLQSFPISGGEPAWFVPAPESAPSSSDESGFCCASFSRDGRQVAYLLVHAGLSELFVQTLSPSYQPEGQARQLTDFHLLVSTPAWMPDGQSLVVGTGERGSHHLWRVFRNGQPSQLMEPMGDQAGQPAISPTGQLVFARSLPRSAIWQLDVTKPAQPQQILQSTRANLSPHFSPDGKRIAFISTRTGSSEVWIANRDGTNTTRLTSMQNPITGWPHWSPDGSRIAFDSSPKGVYHHYTISAAGGEPVQITSGDALHGVPAWSPDSKTIYFYSNRFGEQIASIPAGGGEIRQVTKQGGRLGKLSPDGRFLYFAKRNGESMGLWRMPLPTGDEKLVVPRLMMFQFEPVDEGVYYTMVYPDTKTMEIRFHSPETGKDRLVISLPNTGPAPGMSVSPDGKTLLYATSMSGESSLMTAELGR